MKLIFNRVIPSLLLVVCILSSCNKLDKDNLSTSEYGNIPAALADSLRSIGSEVLQFKVNSSRDTVVKGKMGTVLFISANSLVDENGVLVTEDVTIELKEHYTMLDFITSNLQTVHNNEILQTQGMIYLSAKTKDGREVKIDKSRPIRIEFPVSERIAEAKIFTGKRDERGHMNWDEIYEPAKLLIPISLYGIAMRSGCFHGAETDFSTIDISEFPNTLISTREFEERLKTSECYPELLRIYSTNLEKNMWELDELMVEQIRNDSGRYLGDFTKSSELFQYREDHARKFHQMIEAFKAFASQKLTRIDTTKLITDSTLAEVKTAFIAFDALKFGWINCDYFWKDPKAEDMDLSIRTNEKVYTITLVFPELNVMMSGGPVDDNTYSFKGKFPKGLKGVIIAISLAEDGIHFAEKEIVMGQNEIETIELKQERGSVIKERLNKLR